MIILNGNFQDEALVQKIRVVHQRDYVKPATTQLRPCMGSVSQTDIQSQLCKNSPTYCSKLSSRFASKFAVICPTLFNFGEKEKATLALAHVQFIILLIKIFFYLASIKLYLFINLFIHFRSKECDVVHGECTQTYVPYLFLVIPLGPVTLTGQDYVLVESGCVCKPKNSLITNASDAPLVPHV